MAYVSVAEWRPEQVTEWLKGLDNSIVSYIHWFSNNEVNGQQLLNLSPDELTHLGVYKLGHQELILEAVQHLRNFHYELDRENLQLLALKLSCTAHSLYSEIRDQAESSSVPTQIMADVANVIHFVKPLVSWLDRPPFAGQLQYVDYKTQLLSLSLKMATSAQRDRFAERPVAEIRTCSSQLAKLADSIVQDITDPMILQPATLDLATIKKKAGEDLDFFLVPSFYGIHQIGDMKLSSPAHQSGKIQQGDEIVQVNYQTVVGWSRKKVLALFEESPNDLLLTLKRRPRHVKMYGQIYMKPYRLPSRKRALPYSRWNDNLPSPRPELLTIPHFDITRAVTLPKKIENNNNLSLEPSGTSSSSDDEFGQPSDSQSPASMRLYLPKPRASIQRRFTLSGPPRPSAQSEQFWRELQLERSWRSNQNNSQINNSSVQNVGGQDRNINEIFHLRDKSASLGNSIATASARSTTCMPFAKVRVGSVKFDLPKFDSLKNDSTANSKIVGERRDKDVSDSDLLLIESEVNSSKSEMSKEIGSSKSLVSNSCGNLTISELNKIKRDAFFNNMDCPNPQSESVKKSEAEGSSEKVKRVIENFKSEIIRTKKDMSEVDLLISPGKVMELIENFGRREAEKNKIEFSESKKGKIIRERNRLDKSCSTPAYDTTENSPEKEYLDKNLRFFASVSKKSPEKQFLFQNKKCDLHGSETRSNDFEKENQLVESSTKVERSSEINFPNKENCYKSATHIKDTCSRREEDIDRSHSPSGCSQETEDSYNDITKTQIFQSLDKPLAEQKNFNPMQNSCSRENLTDCHSVNKNQEVIKPIPAQRKSKLSPEKLQNTNPCPLPPKPRSKPLPISLDVASANCSLNAAPPEPPPRPNSTFLKSTKKTEVTLESREQNADTYSADSLKEKSDLNPSPRKGALAISSPLSTTSYDFKPLSAAPTSPVRKSPKSLNTYSSGTSTGCTSTEKEKSKTGSSTLESLKAMLTLGRKTGSCNSPRTIRKKNGMLAKKRNVSVKEITPFENSGFLWHRNRKGSATASWTKYYFVLQGSNFYGFKSKESNKADLFIHLTGFTCTPAEEVKSKEFSFKIYHTGTVFYFAANSREDLQQWLDSVNLAISFQDDKSLPETVTYSQTDSEVSDTEIESETCFPTSPKMKKVLGSSPVPKPARSHQNLSSESKKTHEIQKRFGSLKKLSSHKQSTPSTSFSEGNESSEIASLDRKYLRFLGQKNSPTPVPTSRFRSYRRMQPAPIIPSKGKTKVKTQNIESSNENPNTAANREPPRLIRKPLHSSNPSLIHPDMADYRITQERLAEFRRLRNQSNASELGRFLAPDHFLTLQDDNFRSNRSRPPEMSGFMTLEQFLLCQEEERQRSLRFRERPTASNDFSRHDQFGCAEERHKAKQKNKLRVPGNSGQTSPIKSSLSNQNFELRLKKAELEKPQVAPRSKAPPPNTLTKLKNVAMYQPPPIPHSASTSTQGEDSIVMAFEMKLDQNKTHQPTPKHPAETDFSRSVECNHGNNISMEYPGIEYPPAFEPETYTLQHMLKNRQKKDSEPKK